MFYSVTNKLNNIFLLKVPSMFTVEPRLYDHSKVTENFKIEQDLP